MTWIYIPDSTSSTVSPDMVGFALGLRLAYPDADFKTVCYIEWDKYCQQVILQQPGSDDPTLG